MRESKENKMIVFISDNSTDFSDKTENKLSNDLLLDTSARGVEINYYKTLYDFAKEQASKIDFITREWIEQNVDIKIIEKLFGEILGEKQEAAILKEVELDFNERITGTIHRTAHMKSIIKDYFVYEKSDGNILLNIEVQIETEYEIEIEKSVEKDNTRYEYVYNTNPKTSEQEMDWIYIPDFYLDQDIDYTYQYPIYIGKFILSINEKTIEKYELKDWEWS